MSHSLSGDIIICSSDTELDCQGLLDRRRRDELCVRVCACVHVCCVSFVVGRSPCKWNSARWRHGGASLTVSVILMRCYQCQDDTATTCVCARAWAHVRRWRIKSSSPITRLTLFSPHKSNSALVLPISGVLPLDCSASRFQ